MGAFGFYIAKCRQKYALNFVHALQGIFRICKNFPDSNVTIALPDRAVDSYREWSATNKSFQSSSPVTPIMEAEQKKIITKYFQRKILQSFPEPFREIQS